VRILHLVTLISPDGAYGGPVRVAINQATELRRRGHSVVLAAAVRGYDTPPTSIEDIPVELAPARRVLPGVGFAGIAAPGLLRWVWKARGEFDVAHIHLARDLVVLPSAMALSRAGMPYVVQPHGMIVPGSNPLAPALDRLAVRRLLTDAHEAFYLTPEELDALDTVARGRARLSPLPNGVPLYEPPSARGDVPEVLYLGRLHPRKRPVDFVTAACALNERGVAARYTLVGPDEGEGERVRAAIDAVPNVSWEGPLPSGTGPDRMRQAAVFVLPSVDEPYPMAVLEAMSVGLPVVITESCGLASIVGKYRCGLVVPPGAEHIERAVAELLADAEAAAAMGARGRNAVASDLGMAHVADRLEHSYAEACA
jgi:glycosyltransferase involved in cell wall biosynthesis